MILYFSATGNCKYVASRLAEVLGGESISIVDCVRQERYSFDGASIGIVSPTYDLGLPSIVKEFLERVSLDTAYFSFISTYGTTTGASGRMANKALRGRKIDAYYSVRMPDTWTPIFDLSTPEKVAAFTKTTEVEIAEVIDKVQRRETNGRMSPATPTLIAELFGQPLYNVKVRKTSHFRVEDGCIGCGLCERNCPVDAIRMENKKPVWVKKRCVMCLGCLHRCPKFAIQYGKNTKKHGQYTNPNVKL